MTAKEYYKSYIADDSLSELSHELISIIERYSPIHVLDFGAGSGKHSSILHKKGISTIAIDVSMMNVVRAHAKYDLPFVACGDETYLRNLANVDIVFTCSVLDHIETVSGIIGEFKRIANKAVILAETQDIPGELYYNHDYAAYGFKKVKQWFKMEQGDGATYYIWKWEKGQNEIIKNGDDLA